MIKDVSNITISIKLEIYKYYKGGIISDLMQGLTKALKMGKPGLMTSRSISRH